MPPRTGKNKAHAFQIKAVESTSWMYSDCYGGGDSATYWVDGHVAGQREYVDADFIKLFEPQPGHWLIKWPHGMITFRDPESFAQDYTHLGGTVYETAHEALFLRGMMSEEGQALAAAERQAKRERQQQAWEEAEARRAAAPKVTDEERGYAIRRVVPGLIPMPEPVVVQPRAAHIAVLPLLANIRLTDL